MSEAVEQVPVRLPSPKRSLVSAEQTFVASQWQLMRWKFFKHKLGVLGLVVLSLVYFMALIAPFLQIHDVSDRSDFIYMQPTPIRMIDASGRIQWPPFVYAVDSEIDLEMYTRVYSEDTTKKYNIQFFVHGFTYKLWGLIPSDIHLVGLDEGSAFYPMGTDDFGRCLFSRIVLGSVISLTVGLIGVAISLVLGSILGGISAFYGGVVDMVVQRIIEFISAIPTIPLWMALSVAIPPNIPPIQVYFGITIVLSLAGWTGLARTVRGKLLQVREEEYVLAARFAGAGDGRIIKVHLLPSMMSYLIVSVTLSIPGMILGETALSFLGLGLRPPTVSWGVLIQGAQNIRAIANSPWMLWPMAFISLTVVAYYFVGDALRDAADPYATI